MHVCFVHSSYGSAAPSGENTAVANDVALLRSAGVTVSTFFKSSDALREGGIAGSIRGGLSCIWNPFVAREFRAFLADTRPDIVHIHNIFPTISPSVLALCGSLAIPTVATFHNLRAACAGGVPSRQMGRCLECVESRSVLPAIVHGCYRGNRVSTLPVAFSIALQRRLALWNRVCRRIFVFSEFQKSILARYGIDSERMVIRANVSDDKGVGPSTCAREDWVLFVGRLSEEKGVRVLLDAWRLNSKLLPRLKIVGDGPLSAEMRRVVEINGLDGRVEFIGHIPNGDVHSLIRKASMVVIPSICYEGSPVVAAEAMAAGTPLILADIGALKEMAIGTSAGELFCSGDPLSLSSVIQTLSGNALIRQRLGAAGRRAYEGSFSPSASVANLIRIYKRVVQEFAKA